MNVREANADDASAVAAVARESWHAAYDDLLSPSVVDETVDAWYDPTDLREQIAQSGEGGSGVYVAEIDGSVVGFAHVYGGSDGRNDASTARSTAATAERELGRLYVREAQWARGVGTALLDRAATDLAADGVERLRTVVFANNDGGRRFYDARGFEVRGERTEAFGGERYDQLVLVASLSELRSE
ncbi:hypothetical protein AUR64_12915 [Haloprofundus marisrubri]|uniref:N-acetyltransferase domain-containing protein n=1 Tax=Haloprofundus marisrubri TaxID=1514971 RepID=A0A0W1RAA7_9EURY|nr:GNAT family N-acetyltransferase [Haloprofundus marisrubri]KTG10457.1 hypothetical protein AUR64_12915 [Haloprofundus marisrubri]